MSHPYFFISKENISGSQIEIFGDDLKHLSQVLRAKPGDKVEISDNCRYRYDTEIIEIKKNSAQLKVLNKSEIIKSQIEVYLFQCILKRSSMELVIQKAAETGLNAVVPVKSSRIALSEIKDNKKLLRWQKIALEASKQSKRNFKCEVLNELNLNDIDPGEFDVFYIPYEEVDPEEIKKKNIVVSLKEVLEERKKRQKTVSVVSGSEDCPKIDKLNAGKEAGLKIGFIIGPEGGFEESEALFLAKKGALRLSLGSNILKAETAAIFMSSIIKYILEIY
ncbi:MAG: 16S rRNA (uracil(1498)-N(3))-methyltransferase [Actinobacteria bacterium]|nr:16S rRNA (uracil(1498)-N(3))-methyltransferase [Actinomycetota bacterium]